MEPVALHAYEALAESYARLIGSKAHNALYERPATLSLLPEVVGKQVLDAGCLSRYQPRNSSEWSRKTMRSS